MIDGRVYTDPLEEIRQNVILAQNRARALEIEAEQLRLSRAEAARAGLLYTVDESHLLLDLYQESITPCPYFRSVR